MFLQGNGRGGQRGLGGDGRQGHLGRRHGNRRAIRGRGVNRAEAICQLPLALSRGKTRWLVLYDAPGADRRDGAHVVFGDLLRRV